MLLEEILSKSNMESAYARVTSNKGSAGVDGVDVAKFRDQLKRDWTLVKSQLESGSYQPNAVKRVTIPKPDGGQRHLGVPTYQDRLIQQSISQVLTKLYDATFSENSYGFRKREECTSSVVKGQGIH